MDPVVADVPVHAVDVRVGVVLVVVAVLPLLRGGHVVPLVLLAVDQRVVHPVVLAVHDVVADLHVLEDLGHAEQHDAGDERRPEERHEQADAAEHLEQVAQLDDPPDVVGVGLAEVVEDALAHGVELAAELLELLVAHQVGADGGALVGVGADERLRRLVVVAGAQRLEGSVLGAVVGHVWVPL